MRNNHLLVFMILAAVLVISTACSNSSDASKGGEDTQSENQHSTQSANDNQSNTNAVKNATNDNDTNANTHDTKSNDPDKETSNNKPAQEKDTSANNTEGKKQAYLKQLNETEKEMEKQQNNLENNSTYALKAVAGNRSEAWDDHLNDIYDTLEKQLSPEEMDQLRQEQREWMSNRDDQAKEASLKYEGGTQEQLEYVAVKANITKDRCYELVEDYMK